MFCKYLRYFNYLRIFIYMSEVICMQTIHYYITNNNVVSKIKKEEKNVKSKELVHILLQMYMKDIDNTDKKS